MSVTLPQSIICGYFDCSIFGDLKQSPERVRTIYEIEYFLEDGKLTYTDGISYPIKKGYIKIGIPGERCNSLLPFKTKYVKFSAEGKLAELLETSTRYFRSKKPFEVEKMLDELISLYHTNEYDELLLGGKLLVFISTVITESSITTGSAMEEIIIKAKKYIEEHFKDPIKLSDIAFAVNLSPNYLHTRFRNEVGITPREYLIDCRLKKACELLSTTSKQISEIAEKCGFCNQQYLTLLFKKKYNITPIAYRKDSGCNYLI